MEWKLYMALLYCTHSKFIKKTARNSAMHSQSARSAYSVFLNSMFWTTLRKILYISNTSITKEHANTTRIEIFSFNSVSQNTREFIIITYSTHVHVFSYMYIYIHIDIIKHMYGGMVAVLRLVALHKVIVAATWGCLLSGWSINISLWEGRWSKMFMTVVYI